MIFDKKSSKSWHRPDDKNFTAYPQKLVLWFLIEKIIIYNEKKSDPKNIFFS